LRFARTLNGRNSWGEGSQGRRLHPRPSAFHKPKRLRASGSRFGSKSTRSRVRCRRSEFPASREFSCAAVDAPFQKVPQCHDVAGFTTRRLRARAGAEQGISNVRNRSLSGAFGAEQGKNRWAKTGRGAGRGRVVRRGQDSLPQPGGVALARARRERAAPLVQRASALVHRFLKASRWRPWPLPCEMLDLNRQDMIRVLETLH
jgi:hypothetical protein